MKVAHVITRLILGGAQENTVYSCIDLAARHSVEVRLLTGPTVGPEGSLVQFARSAGVEIIEIPSLIRAINPFYDIPAYYQLKSALRDFKPDIVHTHSAKAGILGRQASAALRVPFIVHTIHGAPWYKTGSRFSRLFNQTCERWAAKKCDALVSVADAMTELFLDAKIADSGKFTTIYSGMDVQPFLDSAQWRASTRAKWEFSETDIVIGKIARLFRLKGHDDLIIAAKKVVDRNPVVKFLLVGDGILRQSLQEKVRRAGLQNHFIFAGLIPSCEIPAMISAMDIVVHTSLREGLARVLPQALISGKPVVSYDIDGAKEVVLPDKTGYLIPPRNIDLLSQALIELSLDKQKRTLYGNTGRVMFTDQFRREVMADKLYELYNRALSERKD